MCVSVFVCDGVYLCICVRVCLDMSVSVCACVGVDMCRNMWVSTVCAQVPLWRCMGIRV